jgi:hypothetical protein
VNAGLIYFANVSNDPFSIGWPEGSGFYYASLYFSLAKENYLWFAYVENSKTILSIRDGNL